MKKTLFLFCLFSLFFVSCRNLIVDLSDLMGKETHVVESIKMQECLSSGTITIPSAGYIISEVRGKKVTPFAMNKYETTYRLWYDIRKWAENNDYIFLNLGREGVAGSIGAEPDLGEYKPVSTVSWYDCALWCNALSEKSGRKPVYYVDSEFLQVFRTPYVTTDSVISAVYADYSCNGYRLPTYAEWEYAARGGDINSSEWKYAYSGSNNWHEVCVANRSDALPVGSLRANSLGMHDMSGNMWEWISDCSEEPRKTLRGGCYGNDYSVEANGTETVDACRLSYHQFASSSAELVLSWGSFRIAYSLP